MHSKGTDRNVGTLDLISSLPHHLSPTPSPHRKLPRHNSETSLVSPSNTPAVPRSSSFTGSKRFLTGKGLSARESLGIIDQPERNPTNLTNPHCDYHAARNIIRDTLTHSPKETPPPPQPQTSAVPFVGKRPPTPPPLPDFTTPPIHVTPKRVHIDSSPFIEPPAAAPIHTPPGPLSTPEQSLPSKQLENDRTPLRALSPRRNRFSLTPPAATNRSNVNPQDPKVPRQTLFGLFSSRITRRDAVPHTPERVTLSEAHNKQNTAPLNIAELANAVKIDYPTRRTDENNKPVAEVSDTSSDDSAMHQIPNAGKRIVMVDQTHPDASQRQHAPLGREKRIVQLPKDNESTETTESDKYKDCESPVMEPKRRVEMFRRFRFVQEGRQRPEQLSDFVQTDVPENAGNKPVSVASAVPLTYKTQFEAVDPISHHEDKLSFTSAHEDGECSSDEQAPPAMRDIRKDPRMRMRLPRPVELEPKIFEEEKEHLPHVESMTTSSSSHSKDTTDSPPTERKMTNAIHDTSVPFSQAEMPHLRLGRGNVTAHAFMQGPSPSKMGRVAQMRRDSHAAFLNINGETKLEEIKYGGHQGERETVPLGSSPAKDGPKEGGEIKRTMSGIQRKLKEAGAELVSKAKKIPRGASFSKLRSSSMKDLRSAFGGNDSETEEETDDETPGRKMKGIERSKSLPRDSLREMPPHSPQGKDSIANKSLKKEEKKVEGNGAKDGISEMPEFVTIKRIIRRVRRDGTEEMVTKKVRVRPERILPNGDVVIKRTMKRNKDDGAGTETLTVLQVIPRRKNIKKMGADGVSDGLTTDKQDIASLPNLGGRDEDKEAEEVGGTNERFGSFEKRRSSGRSKTDMVDEGGRWRRARSFGRIRGDMEAKEKCETRAGVVEGVKGFLPRSKSSARTGDRETGTLGGIEEGRMWLKKKSLPRVMSFHGRSSRRKESGASNKSEGSWWRFRRGHQQVVAQGGY